jgi:hypothetical protein
MGYGYYEGINTPPLTPGAGLTSGGAAATSTSPSGNAIRNFLNIPTNVGTGNDQFQNNLIYNLTMPLARKLSFNMSVTVSNIFNHIPRMSSPPVGVGITSGGPTNTNSVIPYVIENPTNPAANIMPNGAFPYGYYSQNYLINNYANVLAARRSISMSTGLRF